MKQYIVVTALALASAVLPAFAKDPAAESPALAASTKSVVSNEKGASLDLVDIDAHLATIPAEARAGVMNDPDRIDQILNQLLILRTASNEAKALGLDKDPIVAREMQIAGERVLFRYRMDKLKADIKFPDFEQQAKERYLAKASDYMTPERVDVSHILIMPQHDRSEDQQRELAESLRKKLKKDPTRFEELAKKYSDDEGSANKGGRLNMAPVANYVEDFGNATKALTKEGEISEVVKSTWGLHVIKFHGREAAALKPYDDVKEGIIATLKSDLMRSVQSEYVQNMRSLKIEADPEVIASLRTRYGELPEPPVTSEQVSGQAKPAE